MKAFKIATALVLLAVAAGTFWHFAVEMRSYPFSSTQASGQSRDSILVEIPRDKHLSEIASLLTRNGLIPSRKIFLLHLRIEGLDRSIRAGYYRMPRSNSVREMAHILTEGKMAVKTVTIPEGKATWELYGLVKQDYELDSLVLDSLMFDSSFAVACGLPADRLEGYLFPDTYHLPYSLDEKELLGIMTRRFHEAVASLDTANAFVRERGLHALVTLASIVEKEAAVRSEQTLISGVFHNRLHRGWALGADPTVRFAIRRLTGPLYVSELNSDSPYNTRKFAGLPPGPICSPGLEALQATLAPEETDHMYFVAKDDGSREHFFSKTHFQHNRYKQIAARNRRQSP